MNKCIGIIASVLMLSGCAHAPAQEPHFETLYSYHVSSKPMPQVYKCFADMAIKADDTEIGQDKYPGHNIFSWRDIVLVHFYQAGHGKTNIRLEQLVQEGTSQMLIYEGIIDYCAGVNMQNPHHWRTDWP